MDTVRRKSLWTHNLAVCIALVTVQRFGSKHRRAVVVLVVACPIVVKWSNCKFQSLGAHQSCCLVVLSLFSPSHISCGWSMLRYCGNLSSVSSGFPNKSDQPFVKMATPNKDCHFLWHMRLSTQRFTNWAGSRQPDLPSHPILPYITHRLHIFSAGTWWNRWNPSWVPPSFLKFLSSDRPRRGPHPPPSSVGIALSCLSVGSVI